MTLRIDRTDKPSPTYLLKTAAGRAIMAFNSKGAALAARDARQAKLGIPLEVVRQVTYERKVA
jgi:hypothetical protein